MKDPGLIVFALLIVLTFTGWWYTNRQTFEDLVHIDIYNGEYEEALLEAEDYLMDEYPKIPFDLYVYVGEDKTRLSNANFRPLRNPFIVLNEHHLGNEAWLRDINRIASLWGLPEVHIEDFPIFWTFHEMAHILQHVGIRKELKKLPRTPEVIRVVNDYRLNPRESDADFFALKELSKIGV